MPNYKVIEINKRTPLYYYYYVEAKNKQAAISLIKNGNYMYHDMTDDDYHCRWKAEDVVEFPEGCKPYKKEPHIRYRKPSIKETLANAEESIAYAGINIKRIQECLASWNTKS